MGKTTQAPDYSANTPEKNIELLAEKDAKIAELEGLNKTQGSAITSLEKENDELKAKNAQQATDLAGGIEDFEVDGKTITTTLPGIKHNGKIVSFGKKFIPKQAKQGKVVFFGDMTDEEKTAIVNEYPHIFKQK